MEQKTVSAFLRVAELQSFSRAAEQLGYSQAAVTVHIQHLEEELGVQLFERIGKRTKLTERGLQFLPYAKNFLKAAWEAETFAHSGGEPSGKLRIGTAESLAISVLPPVLLEFHRRCPLVETSIHTGLITELFDMVRQNTVDVLYFLDKKTYFSEWVKVLEKPEPIVFVASRQHPYAGQSRIPLEKILSEPFLLTESGVSYRYDLEQMVAARNLALHPFLETGNTDVIVKILRKQWGISFLPQYTVQSYLDGGELSVLQVDAPEITMWSQLVYHKNKWITPQMQTLLDVMREVL